MDSRGYTLLQGLFSVMTGIVLILSLLPLLRLLLATDPGWIQTEEGERYPVAPSWTANLAATRYHLAFTRLREEADQLLVRGGEVWQLTSNPGTGWGVAQQSPWSRGTDWSEVSDGLEQESWDIRYRRLGWLGTDQFWDRPYRVSGLAEPTGKVNRGDFSVVLLRGRQVSAVAQVRRTHWEEGGGWNLWDAELSTHDGRRWEYRVAWQEESYPEPEEHVSLPFGYREYLRNPGARHIYWSGGAPAGSHLVFSEVAFPDPLQQLSHRQEQAGSLPGPRFHYLTFKH